MYNKTKYSYCRTTGTVGKVLRNKTKERRNRTRWCVTYGARKYRSDSTYTYLSLKGKKTF